MSHETIKYLSERLHETESELQDLLKRISRWQEQIEKGQEEVGHLRQKLSWFHSELEKASTKYGIDPQTFQNNLLVASEIETKTSVPSLTKFTIADEVYRIIKETGRPMSISELTNMLIESDKINSEAQNPRASVHTALKRRKDVFEMVGKGIWKIRGEKKQESSIEQTNNTSLEDDNGQIRDVDGM